MEDNEEREGGISLGDIFRTIFSQKWLALILAVAITVIGTVGLYLMGKNSEEYVSTFTLRLPGTGDNPILYIYPDGSRFHYTDMMTTSELVKIKNSDEDFANIDVEKIVENGDISITREMVPIAENATDYEPKYTLSIKTNYFKTEEIARRFIMAVTEIPARHLSEMKADYDAYLTASASALTYSTQLSYLQSQINYLNGMYNSFINDYSGSFMVEDGKTLNYYKSQIDVFVANNRINQLSNEALENGYVKSEASLSEYRSALFECERQLKVENQVYDALVALLKETSSTAIFDNPQIIEQQRTIKNLELKRDDLNKYINSKTVNEQFNNSITEVETQIRQFTTEFAKVADVVYESAATVNFTEANVMKIEGGRGLVMSVLISLVVGIIVAAVVAYIVGWQKLKKSGTALSAEAPVFAEAQAQAAITEDEEENKDN